MMTNSSWLKVRVFIVLGSIVFFFGVIFLRAFQVQVLDGGALGKLARNQHNKSVKVTSKRGAVLDRNLKEFAVSLEVDSVFVQPARVDGVKVTSRTVARALGMTRLDVERRLGADKSFAWVKRQVDLPQVKRETLKELGGIGIMKESRRFYPNKRLSSNLVGFAGVDSKGLEGVELYYDRFLKGASHTVDVERDARGKVLLYEDFEKRSRGMDVVLTIDMYIQYIAEKALKKAVDSSGAKGGTVVVMDPRTGEVLAMATLPTFDPNSFRSYTPGDWRNRPVTDSFEPGSTFKVFLLAALLDDGVARPRDIFFCENGSYEFADVVFHDSKEHGWLSLGNIIKVSSNIGALKAAGMLGSERFYKYLHAFGFGERTGVDLPGEAKGRLRHYRSWNDVDLYSMAFGQGVSVTAVQMATALSSIANGGFLMKPYVVRSVRAPAGDTVFEASPEIVRRVISEKTASEVAEILVTVTEPGGTGILAAPPTTAIESFQVAGKTGTAQKADLIGGGYMVDKYVASFIGFVPAGDPRLTIVVNVDEPVKPYTGGAVAAPVFKEIAEAALAYLGHYPGGFQGDGRGVVAVAGGVSLESEILAAAEIEFETDYSAVPDFSRHTMRSVLRTAAERSIEIKAVGSGRAVRQSPGAGGDVPDDSLVTVWFK